MDTAAQQRIDAFVKKWEKSGGNERANYQGFFLDLCTALGVETPPPKGNVADDPFCFDKDIKVYHPSGKVTAGYIDFYKADHFIIEAKQGSDQTGKGTAKRGTPSYLKAMEKAFVQAIAYTRNVATKPPFLLTCDIGDHFELWTGFNGDYGGYAARQDIELAALKRDDIFDLFVDIFTDPQKRNPEKIAAKVTREVAADLAELTKSLERSPANSPSPLTPLPSGEGDRLPSPVGRRAGDESEWDGEFSRLAGRWRQIPDEYIEKARELRRNQTPTEKLLWELLRAKRFLGAKFRRQHKIGQFIADFYCHEARLVIELDGAVHDQQARQDCDRDQWMQANGITVLRFRNAEVADNTEAVLNAIAEVISPSPLAPSPKGEGNRSDLPSPIGRRAGDEGLAGDEGHSGDEGYNHAQAVAHFLMRCIFTMFAEDVGLLKEQLFTEALSTRWKDNPTSFKPEVEALWQAMNEGGSFGFHGQLLRFNGGLFADPVAFDLSADQIQILLNAAERDWQNVEPAIFGTLLERALDTKERSKLGAHYTPRSYVERLVKPVVMEPLQAQWVVVQGEAKQQLGDDPTPAKKKKAIATLEAFLTELRQTRILDPACGTGNFLYVTLDLMKQLESEVLKRLEDITGQAQLRLDIDQVNPSQFLGIEINPRAAAIADLVIWIGYLQWHFRRFGDLPPVEPVLREYHNIECRDAVLAYDGKEEDVDPATGQVRSRWGGRKMRHPVTGEEVPDPSDQIPIYRYLNPRPAEWPEADYVVSNPPFIGNKRMRGALGDGYVETLRRIQHEVPEPSDFVMYWWNQAAKASQEGQIKRFGFITTNSITNSFNRKVVENHLSNKLPIFLRFAIPDHPWVDSAEGAAVRVSMTVGSLEKSLGKLLTVEEEIYSDDGISSPIFSIKQGLIHSNLTVGADVVSMKPLKSNHRMAFQGVIPECIPVLQDSP
jgi:very-short-patch-repair endonuclease